MIISPLNFIVAIVILMAISLGIYFIPSVIAKNRRHHNLAAIFVLNIFLGWTLLGWVGALVWAFTRPVARVES